MNDTNKNFVIKSIESISFKPINIDQPSYYTEVSKDIFYNFINKYNEDIHKLYCDVCGIYEPPLISYNDFSLGDWPESIVGKIHGDKYFLNNDLYKE